MKHRSQLLSIYKSFVQMVPILGESIFLMLSVSFFLLKEPCLSSLVLVLMLKMVLLSVSIVISLKLHELFSFPLLRLLIFGLKLYLLLYISSIFSHHLVFRANALEKSCMGLLLDIPTFVFLVARVMFFYLLMNAQSSQLNQLSAFFLVIVMSTRVISVITLHSSYSYFS